MSFNVPDDWNTYYSQCEECGTRTHASEGHSCMCPEEEQHDDITTFHVSREGVVYHKTVFFHPFSIEIYHYKDGKSMFRLLTPSQRLRVK